MLSRQGPVAVCTAGHGRGQLLDTSAFGSKSRGCQHLLLPMLLAAFPEEVNLVCRLLRRLVLLVLPVVIAAADGQGFGRWVDSRGRLVRVQDKRVLG